ncbi:hypothetical protein CLU79DRAFT_770336, partial [Phycomyces nitens]
MVLWLIMRAIFVYYIFLKSHLSSPTTEDKRQFKDLLHYSLANQHKKEIIFQDKRFI